jgi:hypothetical protein
MFGTRRFMDEAPVLGLPVFQSLANETRLSQGAQITPTPPPVVQKSTGSKIAAAALAVGAIAFGLELTGVTHVTGLRKALMR